MKPFLSILLSFLFPLLLCSQSYNFYRGNIHAHTAYSDGNKDGGSCDTPYESFIYAKDALQFDFLGISEHNHSGAGMSLSSYSKGLAEADSANDDSSFVSMYGMEWGTISGGGHVVIYGVDSLIGWEAGDYHIYNAKTDYDSIFRKVAGRSNAFAYLAHPDISDYDSICYKPRKAVYDQAIIGLAVRSGSAFSEDTTYSDPSSSSYYARYKDLLGLGYHLGPGIDHDNHYTTFGKHTPARLVVLATELTKEKIFEALQQSRFYASDDWNVEVDFTVNGSYMGSKLEENADPSFKVNVYDPDTTDSIKYIRLKHGVPGSGNNPLSAATSNDDTSLTYTHSINDGDEYYYYLEIRQYDDDMIYSAPVRFKKNTTLPMELIEFEAEPEGEAVQFSWATAAEVNNDYFKVQRSLNGIDFNTIGKLEAAGNSNTLKQYGFEYEEESKGTIYYRLKQVDFNGKSSTSDLLHLTFTQEGNGDMDFQVNHTGNSLDIEIDSKIKDQVDIRLHDLSGKLIYSRKTAINRGRQHFQIPLENYSKGMLMLRIIAERTGSSVAKKIIAPGN